MASKEKQLGELHELLTQKLLDKLNDPECKASDLNVARQFLKDNGIEAIPVENSNLAKLASDLPFKIEEVLGATRDLKN